MQFLNLAAALTAISSVTAAPLEARNGGSGAKYVDYVDKFDDHFALPQSAGVDQPVNVYHALRYSGFAYQNTSLAVSGPQPPSKPNVIYGSIDLLKEFQFLPANSSISSFDLKSIYYGCTTIEYAAPQTCTIQIAGRKAPANGGTTAVYELIYDPALAAAPLAFATLPARDFSNLVEASIAIISSKTPYDTTIFYFDNVAYRTYFTSKK